MAQQGCAQQTVERFAALGIMERFAALCNGARTGGFSGSLAASREGLPVAGKWRSLGLINPGGARVLYATVLYATVLYATVLVGALMGCNAKGAGGEPGNPATERAELDAPPSASGSPSGSAASSDGKGVAQDTPSGAPSDAPAGVQTAVFAGGCFWCMEVPYEKLEGVSHVESGYSGGNMKNPTYEDIGSGQTGHREVIRVVYDPRRISYAKLLEVFWKNVDPTDAAGQFCDKGFQYTSAIYVASAAEKQAALASRDKAAEALKTKIVTEIVDLTEFWPAEDYHQDYYKKNPVRYKYYRFACGRDQRLEKLWGEAPDH